MRLGAKKLYYLLLGLSVLAFGALLGATYAADALLRQKAGDVREARLNSLALEQQQRQLIKAKAAIQANQQLADIAKHIVPQDKDQAQTVREIVNIAAEHNIKLSSVAFPSSTLGSKNDEYSQLTAVKGIPGVYSLDITIQSDSSQPATYADFLAFLEAIEHNRRTALVTHVALQPSQKDANLLTFSLTLREYIKP